MDSNSNLLDQQLLDKYQSIFSTRPTALHVCLPSKFKIPQFVTTSFYTPEWVPVVFLFSDDPLDIVCDWIAFPKYYRSFIRIKSAMYRLYYLNEHKQQKPSPFGLEIRFILFAHCHFVYFCFPVEWKDSMKYPAPSLIAIDLIPTPLPYVFKEYYRQLKPDYTKFFTIYSNTIEHTHSNEEAEKAPIWSPK